MWPLTKFLEVAKAQTAPTTALQKSCIIRFSHNRTVGNGELAGVYSCEFFQTFPKQRYQSPELSVTFNGELTDLITSVLTFEMREKPSIYK